MALVGLDKLQSGALEFIDTRLMPSAPLNMKFKLGISKFAIQNNPERVFARKIRDMKAIGIINDNNQIDTEYLRNCMKAGFQASTYYRLDRDIKIDQTEGEYFISLLEK